VSVFWLFTATSQLRPHLTFAIFAMSVRNQPLTWIGRIRTVFPTVAAAVAWRQPLDEGLVLPLLVVATAWRYVAGLIFVVGLFSTAPIVAVGSA